MENKMVFVEKGKVVTDSILVADKFNKRHNTVLRDIRSLDCSKEFFDANFIETEYVDEKNRRYSKINMTRDGFTFLVMGYKGKNAAQFKEDYINAFNSLEKQSTPQLNTDITQLSPLLQTLIQIEHRQNAFEMRQNNLEKKINEIDDVKESMVALTDQLTAVPDHTVVVSKVKELAHWTRLDHHEVYNQAYTILKRMHGIDIKRRLDNERDRVQNEYHNKKGKYYSESTLRNKVTGIDIMVRMGVLDKFHSIIVGMLAKEKAKRTLKLVK
ncbi:Rha family transcriptional regulator [Paenibacillus chitinolyticus]|uniref:Rha family transcriptional regulator n=1 Tax=Paenibacillus chitinolyticus TaxID=79263 RepID=UPI0036D8E584